MAGIEGKENPARGKPDENVLRKQRAIYRTKVNYNKAYMFPLEDALLDGYSAIIYDIKRMKAADPVPKEILTEAEEELKFLLETMKQAGIEFYS